MDKGCNHTAAVGVLQDLYKKQHPQKAWGVCPDAPPSGAWAQKQLVQWKTAISTGTTPAHPYGHIGSSGGLFREGSGFLRCLWEWTFLGKPTFGAVPDYWANVATWTPMQLEATPKLAQMAHVTTVKKLKEQYAHKKRDLRNLTCPWLVATGAV